VLAIYVTENQRRAFVGWFDDKLKVQTASWMPDSDWEISWRRCGLLTLYYFWPIYQLLMRRPDRAQTLPWLEEFVRYRVTKDLAADLYRRAKPKVVVVSNDHGGMFRAFIRVAREYDLKVVYTQHASIGKNFPPLDFDLSLLDGLQAYLRYSDSGAPRGNVVITGRIRPPPLQRPRSRKALVVGIATNWDDPLGEWIPLLRSVRARFPDVVLRCHPAETRKIAWIALCRLFQIRVDSGTLDSFLSEASVLISGVSGIVLDAALRGVPSLVYLSALRRSEKMFDYFGYQQFGLCKLLTDVDELIAAIDGAAARSGDFARAGVYEAGIVQDPLVEKREALLAFVNGMGQERGVESELRKRYVTVVHRGCRLFMSEAYAQVVDEQGWLLAQEGAR
jgi:hypothetical protein